MFPYWPILTATGFAPARSVRHHRLQDLDARMSAFLAEKGDHACDDVIQNVRADRKRVQTEARDAN